MLRNRLFIVGLVVIVCAIIVGGAVGASSVLITSSSQIKNGVVTPNKLSEAVRVALDGKDGTDGKPGKPGKNGTDGTNGTNGLNGKDSTVPGPQGNAGGTGPKGDTGAPGDSYLKGAYYSVAYYDVGNTNGGAIATVACSSESDTAISGGTSTDDITKVVPVGTSFPGRMDWTTNTPKPGRLDGWIVQFASQTSAAPLRVKVWALCVPNLSIPVVQTYQQSVDG